MSATIPLSVNRLNAAKMIAGELRQKRKLTDAIVQSAIDKYMVTKNPPRKIREAIIEEAQRLAKGKCSLEVTEIIVEEHQQKSANTTSKGRKGVRALGRKKLYKAGTKWGREERPAWRVVKDARVFTSPGGIVRVKGIAIPSDTADGSEWEVKPPAGHELTLRMESTVLLYGYGGIGMLRGRVNRYEETQRIGDGYGKVSVCLEWAWVQEKTTAVAHYEAMEKITHRLKKDGTLAPMDPEEHYYLMEKKPGWRKPICLYLAIGEDYTTLVKELGSAMISHLRGKVKAGEMLK